MADAPASTPTPTPTPAPAATPAATPPPTSPTTTPTSPAEVPPNELAEKEVKKAFLQKFRRKPKADAAQTTDSSEPKQLTPEETAEKLYREIQETKDKEYLVLRIKKHSVLTVMGLLLILLWLIPLSKWLIGNVSLKLPFAGKSEEVVTQNKSLEEPSATQSASLTLENVVIRVRDNGSPGMAEKFANLLKENGISTVEVIKDPEANYEGIEIVVKPGAADIRQELETILKDTYEIASPSAELTQDSEIDVVVLFGLRTASDSAQAQ